jgi:hypothetical protein
MVDQNKAEENPIEDIQVLGKVALLLPKYLLTSTKVALLVRKYLLTGTKGGFASAKVLAY